MDAEVKTTHYFWDGWFSGQSFAALVGLFSLFSFVDLLATMRLVPLGVGVQEGNPLANYALDHYGAMGFILYKLMLVTLVIASCWLVHPRNARLANGVLWAGSLVMTAVALRHLAIIVALFA
jgi:hypothetical protein